MTKEEFVRKFRHTIGGMVYDAKCYILRGQTGSVGSHKEYEMWEDVHRVLREMYDCLNPNEKGEK